MALLPGPRTRPSIANWPVPMVISQPSHASPVAERPSTLAAFSRGRRPLSSLRRMIKRIAPKSMRSLIAAVGEMFYQVFPPGREGSSLERPRPGQALRISCVSVSYSKSGDTGLSI